MENQKLIAGLESRFPLIGELLFTQSQNHQPEPLPPLIGLMTAMTDPAIPGDACVVLPSRDNVAAFTAVLAALSAAKEHFPKLYRQYIENGFEIGERVRVLPSEHVYEFGGIFTLGDGKFFRLRILNDSSHGVRSFPIKDAVLLEKTTRSSPKGTGGSELGSYKSSPIDDVIKIHSGGNDALLANEIMLVCTQREFISFIETVSVCHIDTPEKRYLLRDVISWGIVNAEGDIEFRDSAAASGAPLIAVASRTEYIAMACRKKGIISPRVVIDGAIRINDLQSFDDIVDYSKLLVLADHTRLDEFEGLAARGCTIWKLPDVIREIQDTKDNLLQKFNTAYDVASEFKLDVIGCNSPQFDNIAMQLKEAERFIKESGANAEDLKVLSIAYSRFIDLAAFVHIPTDESVSEFRASLQVGIQILSRRRFFMDVSAAKILNECFTSLESGLDKNSKSYRIDKQIQLLKLVNKLGESDSTFIVVAPTIYSAESVKVYLNEQSDRDVRIATVQAFPEGELFDYVILTGWPKARHLKKFLDKYLVKNVIALAYQFEEKWFVSSRFRRANQLKRWELSGSEVAKLTGMEAQLNFISRPLPPIPASDDLGFLETEKLFDEIKKGSPSNVDSDHDIREGKYVSFAGSCYGYMTKTHKMPKLTGLISGIHDSQDHLPLEVIDDLEVGDYVLFRANDGSQKDLIRQIAEHNLGEEKYKAIREKSEMWKVALILLGSTQREVADKLHSAGMDRGSQTIRNWMNDPARIGPQAYDDLVTIASCASGKLLAGRVEQIWEAIRQVRSAHSAAGMKLSKLLVEHLPSQLPDIEEEETVVDLVLGDIKLGKVLILQIDNIGDKFEKRAYWEVNQILTDF